MYITKDIVNEIHSTSKENLKAYDGYIDQGVLASYESLLDKISSAHTYAEGEKIATSDLKPIRDKAINVIENIAYGIIDRKDRMLSEERNGFDCRKTLVSVCDHLFALAQKKLGCPNMPEGFGDLMREKVDLLSRRLNAKLKTDDYFEISEDKHYKDQRGKNADELKDSLCSLIEGVKERKASSLEAGKLLAEYRALQKRQQRHTFIWKIFHGDESEARTALLREMKDALVAYVGPEKAASIDTRSASDFAYIRENSSIVAYVEEQFKDGGMAKRLMLKEGQYGLSSTSAQRANEESVAANRLFANGALASEESKEQGEIKTDERATDELHKALESELNNDNLDSVKPPEVIKDDAPVKSTVK